MLDTLLISIVRRWERIPSEKREDIIGLAKVGGLLLFYVFCIYAVFFVLGYWGTIPSKE
jgi:hypothetical protein